MSEADSGTVGVQDTGENTALSFDGPDADPVATIVTSGDPVRSLVNGMTKWLGRSGLEEAKLTFTADEVRMRAVDPANVGMADVTAYADGFSGYRFTDEDALTIGVPFQHLTRALGYARKRPGKGDPVRIDVVESGPTYHVRVAVIRSDQGAKRITDFFTIDPDTIREEPDIPDLDLPYRADPSVDALKEAVNELHQERSDYGWLATDDGTLVIGTQPTANPNVASDALETTEETGNVADVITFPDHAWTTDDQNTGQGSLFSFDYLEHMTKAIKKAKANRVTLSWGDEFPAMFDWEHSDYGFEGTYMVAPRIEADE